MSNIEQTLSIIKPDAVERKLENEIKEMFKNTGFNINKAIIELNYHPHSFIEGLQIVKEQFVGIY